MKNNTTDYIEEEIDLLQLLGIILRYKRFIIITTSIFTLSVVVFSLVSLALPPEKSPLPNVYEPTSMILINDQMDGGGLASLLSSGISSQLPLPSLSLGGRNYGELAIQLLESKSILDIIAEEYIIANRYKITKHIKGDSRNAIKKHLKTEYDMKTGILTIKYKDYDPEFAQAVVNRMVALLDQRFASIGGNKTLTQKRLLETKLVDVEAGIARLETRIQNFQTEYGVLDIASLATEQITMMARLRSQLILKDMEIRTYQDFAPQINDPILKRLQAERQNLLGTITDIENGFSEYDRILPPQKELPELALKFSHMKRDLLIQNKIYEILTQKYEFAKLSLEGEEPIFQVLELADVPDLKAGPRRSLICIGVTFAVFFLTTIFSLIHNTIRKIRKDPELMKKLSGISSYVG